ncbi:MAG TPA: glycosyltransferase [Verrucomicrobiae bacterium]|nr:glycosyltransferase [Verrucomicrobiae bacterium]
MKPLVFIPTYNERGNVGALYTEIRALGLDLDILFMDDNSPDGTGKVVDELAAKDPGVRVLHRSGKLGVGSAHAEGIAWAYDHGYRTLVTMDCDFTHPPAAIAELLRVAQDADVVVGSRYLAKRSLAGWNLMRKVLTVTGHLLTRVLLGMTYDATGAFRLYRLDRIPRQAFGAVSSKGYSFFFESLYILHFNRYRIREIPIALPPRTYGHSKMSFREVRHSVALLFSTCITRLFNKEKFQVAEVVAAESINPDLRDTQGWDAYWQDQKSTGGILYDTVAAFYRKVIIRRTLNHFVRSYFRPGARVLHAGCGGGQVDTDIAGTVDVTGLDISVNALNFYKRTLQGRCHTVHGSIFDMPIESGSMEGIYNLGVMEHFTEEEIDRILLEFHRVLRQDGRLILFWPPEFGASVMFLKGLNWGFENVLGKKQVKFHPDEITRVRSRRHVTRILERNGFEVLKYSFGPRDLFTYAVIVAEKGSVARDARAAGTGRPPGAPDRGDRDRLDPAGPPPLVESRPPDLVR